MNFISLSVAILAVYCFFQGSYWFVLLVALALALASRWRWLLLLVITPALILQWLTMERPLLGKTSAFYAHYRIEQRALALTDSIRVVLVANSLDPGLNGKVIRLRLRAPLAKPDHWFYSGRIVMANTRSNSLPLFAYPKWLRGEGFDGVATAIGPQRPLGVGRNRKKQSLLALYAGFAHLASGDFLYALSSGDTSLIPPPRLEQLRKAGVAHLTAVSGLHIGILYALLHGVSRSIWPLLVRSGIRSKTLTMILFCLVIVPYLYLISMPFSAVRASAMVMISAWLWQRGVKRRSILLLVLLSFFVFWPQALRNTGFWLSWTMAAALVLAGGFLTRRRGLAPLCFVLFIGGVSAPLAMHFFGYWSLSSLINNLLLVPLVSVVIYPLCLMGLFFWNGFFSIADQFAQVFFYILDLSAHADVAIYLGLLPGPWAVVSVLSVVGLALPVARVHKYIAMGLLSFVLLFPKEFAYYADDIFIASVHRGKLSAARQVNGVALATNPYIGRDLSMLIRAPVRLVGQEEILRQSYRWNKVSRSLCDLNRCYPVQQLQRIHPHK